MVLFLYLVKKSGIKNILVLGQSMQSLVLGVTKHLKVVLQYPKENLNYTYIISKKSNSQILHTIVE